MSTYASFQGRVYLGRRDAAGNPIEVRSPGNVAELKLSLKTDVLEHFESQTGQRTLDHRMVKQKPVGFRLGNQRRDCPGQCGDADREFARHPIVGALGDLISFRKQHQRRTVLALDGHRG